jgi:hypothetical protein
MVRGERDGQNYGIYGYHRCSIAHNSNALFWTAQETLAEQDKSGTRRFWIGSSVRFHLPRNSELVITVCINAPE